MRRGKGRKSPTTGRLPRRASLAATAAAAAVVVPLLARIHPSDPKAEKAFFLLPNVDLALTLLSFRAAPCVCSYDILGEGR